MSTDNRTNEQIVADAIHSNLCCSNPLCGEGQWVTTSAAVVEALNAANRLALPPGEGAVERAARALYKVEGAIEARGVGFLSYGESEDIFKKRARAALMAAVTAPQAEPRESNCRDERCQGRCEMA